MIATYKAVCEKETGRISAVSQLQVRLCSPNVIPLIICPGPCGIDPGLWTGAGSFEPQVN